MTTPRHLDSVQRVELLAQELMASLQRLDETVAQFGRRCCLHQLREGLTSPCTEDEIKALLQIASKGRVHREDRARAPRGLADGRLLTLGAALEALFTQEHCSIAVLTDLVNAEIARLTNG